MKQAVHVISDRVKRYSFRRFVVYSIFALSMLILPIFFGMVLSLSTMIFNLVIVGIIAGLALLAFPMNALLSTFLVITFFVVGPIVYFANLATALWIPYLLGFVLYVRFLIELMRLRLLERSMNLEFVPDRHSSSIVAIMLALFFLIFIVSYIFNRPPLLQTFVAARSYLFLWSLTLILGFCATTPDIFTRVWRFFVFVAVMQFPFVIFQAIYVVGIKGGSWDAITGSFGGHGDGAGGPSGAMAVFLITILTYGVILWREGFWRGVRLFWLSFVVITTILMAEVKVVVVLIPLVVLWAFWKRIFFKPMQGILILGGVLTASLGILFVYQQFFWGENLDLEGDPQWDSKLERTIEYLFAMESDAGFINLERREVSRVGAVYVWIQEHRARYDGVNAFIGHGPGASRTGTFMGMGTVAKNYPFTLMTNTVSTISWDFGLIGLIIFWALLLTTSIKARKLMKNTEIPPRHRAMLEAISIIMGLQVLLTFYKEQIVDVPPEQAWVAVFMGQVLYWDLVIKRRKKLHMTQKKERMMMNSQGKDSAQQTGGQKKLGTP